MMYLKMRTLNNDGILTNSGLTDSDVFALLNVTGLHNPN